MNKLLPDELQLAMQQGLPGVYELCHRHPLSDLHLTPRQRNHLITARVIGCGMISAEIEHQKARSVIQALKATSRMNIADTRRPQDSRITVDNGLDFRLATHPTLLGENLAIRILRTQGLRGLLELGHTKVAAETLLTLGKPEHGLLIVAGATGSGKTTSLHGLIADLGAAAGRAFTLEDPVEIVNNQLIQTDLSQTPNLDFACGLRSLMRQDPDTILVGEIRDQETAQLTLHAALTGHRVLASIHAPDCLGAIQRLMELGIPLNSLLNVLNGVVTQRLVSSAGGTVKPDVEIMALLQLNKADRLSVCGLRELLALCHKQNLFTTFTEFN